MSELIQAYAGEALCALHPERPSTATCVRCGAFTCMGCNEGGRQPFCLSCRKRMGLGAGFPLTRDKWSFGGLISLSLAAFKREWGMLCVASLIFFIGIFGVAMLAAGLKTLMELAMSDDPVGRRLAAIIPSIILYAALGFLSTGMMALLFRVLGGEEADLGLLFSQGAKVLRYLIAMFMVLVVISIAFILLMVASTFVPLPNFESARVFVVLTLPLVPLTWLLLPVLLLPAELAFGEHSALRALRNCYALAEGARLAILGVGALSLVTLLVGALACCVGIVPAFALTQPLLAGLHLALRNGSDLPAE